MEGWIKLYRKITENWIWNDKPFSKGQAWIDLLMRVNHKDGKALIGNKLVEVKRGQTIWSILDMADRWGWSRKKVSNFLNTLESEGMITQKRTTKYTLITIENYDIYQDAGTTEEQQENIKRTTKEQQKNTNKNDKNDNNDKKNIYINTPKKKHYAEFVTMTEEEYNKLVDKYGEEATKRMIEKLDNYKGASGKKYKSDYRAILNWVVNEVVPNQPEPKKEIPQSVLEQIRQNNERVKKMKYDPTYLEEVRRIVQQS